MDAVIMSAILNVIPFDMSVNNKQLIFLQDQNDDLKTAINEFAVCLFITSVLF